MILLVDLPAALAGRIAAALHEAGYRPLRVCGIDETTRVLKGSSGDVALLITADDSEIRLQLSEVAPATRVLNIARTRLDINRLPGEGWVQLVQAVLENPI